ncbi:hypothetical protein GCM10027431_23720 [Lysobacter rhizosphaerae]
MLAGLLAGADRALARIGRSWHASCDISLHLSGAGAKRRLDLEQGLAKRSRGKQGVECRGTFGPFFMPGARFRDGGHNGPETTVGFRVPGRRERGRRSGRGGIRKKGSRRPTKAEQGGSGILRRTPTSALATIHCARSV